MIRIISQNPFENPPTFAYQFNKIETLIKQRCATPRTLPRHPKFLIQASPSERSFVVFYVALAIISQRCPGVGKSASNRTRNKANRVRDPLVAKVNVRGGHVHNFADFVLRNWHVWLRGKNAAPGLNYRP